MTRWRGLLLVVLALSFAACGGESEVGSDELRDFKEQQQSARLGERTPTPKPKATQVPAGQTAAPVQTQAPAVRTSTVDLIAGAPYYSPSPEIRIPAGTTLKIINKDTTPERADGRSFRDAGGAFDSGLIKPGKSWSRLFPTKGTFTIEDAGVPFARATLQVY